MYIVIRIQMHGSMESTPKSHAPTLITVLVLSLISSSSIYHYHRKLSKQKGQPLLLDLSVQLKICNFEAF
ncbi:jg4110 [Pararge aegeria aegeria]|uniref:Jg4110 protein n=1 Tax=Pararge aegeria aegeria TaxID=348720 RepID=A0A8S4RRM2_9NEOP|nr:jg4110 [Pararge aegeria aegeria]